jgi:hypothetical protein
LTKVIRTPVRLILHLLLAIFLANAANKFFVPDLEKEAHDGFYARIFEGRGDAPDQYRILPLLPLKWLCTQMPFHTAVLIYNGVCALISLELLWLLAGFLAERSRLALSFGFALLYIFTQYTGWRPDTLAALLPCLLAALVLQRVADDRRAFIGFGALVIALAFCRADIALVYALFGAFYRQKVWVVLAIFPLLIQYALQTWWFPEAEYYAKTIMLMDNLRLHYLTHNPATYLIVAALVAYARPVQTFLKATIRKYFYFYLLLGGYLVLVLVVGRINEYRLYLPFLPLFLLILHGRHLQARA